MKTIITIITLYLLTSCSTKKQTDFSYFKGAWISDSIYTKENDHWREFLYFDSLGVFNRTTLWGPNYLLSRNLSLNDSSIYEHGKELFKVQIIDSNNIILKGENYYGRFSRDPWPSIGSWQEDLKKIQLSDSNRKLLLGKWKFLSYDLINIDTNQIYPKEFLMTRFKTFRGYKIDEKLIINQDTKYFSINSDSAETKYNYIVNPDKLDISYSDYVIGVPYKLNGDTLTLYDSPMYHLTNEIKFIRN